MDILFFAAVAAFIFFKLSKHLGQIDDEEKTKIIEKIKKAQEQIIQQQAAYQAQQQKSSASETQTSPAFVNQALDQLSDADKNLFSQIIQSCKITPEFFINGAKSAFEMILKAFASQDMETLKFLLSEKIYSGFENAINKRKADNQILTTNVISIDDTKILSVALASGIATISVKFISKQINYISDKDGNIINGAKEDISSVTDIWTFKKDVNVANPNWVVSQTNS